MIQFINNLIQNYIIGNPVSLGKNLFKGVYDLVDKPMTGFVKGPIEGALGLGKGIGSLAKYTISGVFNSVESIADSMGTGISSVSMDSRYLLQRQQIKTMQKNNVFQGIGYASLALFLGLQKGITGVFMQPYRGAKNNKDNRVWGFSKGVIKGMVGVFLKPISGGFDFVALTSEGIKNQATMFDDKPNNNRQRTPRVFYDQEQYYRPYQKNDSEIVQYFKKQKLQNLSFLDAIFLRIDKVTHILTISLEQIILMKQKNKAQVWSLETKYISKIDAADKYITIFVRNNSKNQKDKTILIEKRPLLEYIYERLNYVMEKREYQ